MEDWIYQHGFKYPRLNEEDISYNDFLRIISERQMNKELNLLGNIHCPLCDNVRAGNLSECLFCHGDLRESYNIMKELMN